MDKKDPKKNFHFSFKKITKIYLPIVLTIFIVFNIPIMPDSLGSNTNFNFQPASASGESYFFADNLNSRNSNNNNSRRDINFSIWFIFLIICIIVGFIYFIFNGIKDDTEQDTKNAQDKNDYIELLKDDSDFEGNI